VIGRDGRPLPTRGATPAHAHGWPSAALTPYRLTAGRPPASAGEVVLDAGLARAGRLHVGDRVRVVAPGGAATLRLSDVAQAARDQRERQSALFLTQTEAQRLAGLGAGFNAIAIRADPGRSGAALRDRVRAAVAATPGVSGRPQVLDNRHAASADAGDPRAFERVTLVAVVASGGGLTTAISVFVIAGTIAFVVGRRRREIALLRAVGATPGQVRRLLLWETVLVGLLAGVAGCLAASALMGTFTAALISVDLAPDGFAVAPHWLPWVVAVATGAAVALLAALLAVRRALAVLPGEALVASALPPRRLGVVRVLLGLIALGGGLTLVVTLSSQALSFASLAAFLFAIGIALLAPLLLGWPAALCGRLLRRAGGGGFLAGAALATGRFRVGAVGAAIALIVALAGAQVVSLATARSAAERDSAARVHADRVLVAGAGGGLPPSVAARAARLPGVRAAAGMVTSEG
jgi:putative ABC transport system permease protein